MNWYKKSRVGLQQILHLDNHKVRVYENRIAVQRKDGKRLTWEELQKVKQKVLGDTVCVEVYPCQANVVNLRHTRHLWHSPEISDVVGSVCKHEEFNRGN